MSEYIVAARMFLKNPDRSYFFPSEPAVPDKKDLCRRMKARGTRLVCVEIKHPVINQNTLYSQLRKTRESVRASIEEQCFRVLKSDIWTDEKNTSIIFYELEVSCLPAVRKHIGPPVDRALKEQERFLGKYKKFRPYIWEDRWVADVRRRYADVEGLLLDIVKSRSGFGKNLRDAEDVEILSFEDLLEKADAEALRVLDRLLTPL